MKTRVIGYYVGVILFILGFIFYFNLVKQPQYAKMRETEKKNVVQKDEAKEKEAVSKTTIKTFLKEESPVDLILLMDQSGSMKYTDPQNARIKAAEYIIKNIAEKSTDTVIHRIGVVEFGSSAEAKNQSSLIEVSHEKGVSALLSKLKPQDLGDTKFVDALQRAYEDLTQNNSFDGKRKVKIILFTDGEPDDSRRGQMSMQDYFSEIQNLLSNKFKGVSWDFYVVICDQKGDVNAKTSPYWKKIAGETNVIHIKDIQELNITFNSIVRRIFDIGENVPQVTLEDTKQEESFEIPPYLASMEFHILKAPGSEGLEVAIIKPDGKSLLEDVKGEKGGKVRKTNLTDGSIIGVTNPDPGKWTYKILKGKGKVDILRNEIPVRFSLINPDPSTSYYPQGKPLLIQISYERKDGEAIKEDPANPIIFTGVVYDPEGKEIATVEFNKDENWILTANKTVDTSKEGIYKIILKFTGGVGKFDYHQTVQISVIPFPYLVFKSPSIESSPDKETAKKEKTPILYPGKTLPVEIQVMLAGKPIEDVTSYFDGHPKEWVQIQYETTPGAGIVTQRPDLKEGSKNTYYMEIPLDHSLMGTYFVNAQMGGTAKNSNALLKKTEDSTIIAFKTVPDPSIMENIEKIIKQNKITYWIKSAIGIILLSILLFVFLFHAMGGEKNLGGETYTVNDNPPEGEDNTLGSSSSKIIKAGGKQFYIAREKDLVDKEDNEHELYSIFPYTFCLPGLATVIQKVSGKAQGIERSYRNGSIVIKIQD